MIVYESYDLYKAFCDLYEYQKIFLFDDLYRKRNELKKIFKEFHIEFIEDILPDESKV